MRACGRKRHPGTPLFLADFKAALERVGGDGTLGPHGMRVLGYNLSQRGNGIELTVAHGGWMSEGHSRYERFSQIAVLNIPAGMLGVPSAFGSPDQAREVSRRRATRGVSGMAASVDEGAESDGYDAASDSDERAPQQDLQLTGVALGAPPGYVQVRREYPSGTRLEWREEAGAGEQLRFVCSKRPNAKCVFGICGASVAHCLSRPPTA